MEKEREKVTGEYSIKKKENEIHRAGKESIYGNEISRGGKIKWGNIE